MGTVVILDVLSEDGAAPPALYAAVAQARALLQRADAVFSLWKPESPMSRLRRGELELAEAPPEVARVLELCERARMMTRGWFDPWAMPGGLDPTGLVKGWAASEALGVLVSSGHLDAMVNAGGDIAVSGSPQGGGAWRIGVQHPTCRDRLAAVIEVDGAIATSGTYERGAHLVDPRSGRRRAGFASATVTGPDLALADAAATALAVAGTEGLEMVEVTDGYEALAIAYDGSAFATPGLRRAPA